MPTASTARTASITRPGPDRQAGGAQRAREMHDVGDQRAVVRRDRRVGRVHGAGAVGQLGLDLRQQAARPRPPRIRAMSSWYLSSAPSVSLIVAGSSVDAVERDQRVGPVDRLGDAGQLEQLLAAQLLHEADDLARQPLGRRSGALRRRISSSRAASG